MTFTPAKSEAHTHTHTYPDNTPSTRLSMKKEPMMMRGMKYIQFHALPEASLLWEHTHTHTHTHTDIRQGNHSSALNLIEQKHDFSRLATTPND